MSDRGKQHITFLTLDEMSAIKVVSQALMDNGGKLSALADLEISDEFKEHLKSATEKLEKKIWEVGE